MIRVGFVICTKSILGLGPADFLQVIWSATTIAGLSMGEALTLLLGGEGVVAGVAGVATIFAAFIVGRLRVILLLLFLFVLFIL